MMRTVEVCDNAEWWLVFGSAESESAAESMYAAVQKAIDQTGLAEAMRPSMRRQSLHGWNGENRWARQGSGVGTFRQFTDEEWDAILTAVDRAVEAVNRAAS